MHNLTLNNGVEMPIFGLGVFLMSNEEVLSAVPQALDMGYRLIDTANRYYNEQAVGQAIRDSGVAREEIFVTTKVWFKDHGEQATRKAVETSLSNLGMDYVDLLLIHQPFGDYYAAWRVFEEVLQQGRARAIGVSNFYPGQFRDLIHHNDIVPAVDQCETHPFHQRRALQQVLTEHGCVLQAWGPLGQGNQELANSEVLQQIADAHDASVQQIMLAWLVQRGIAVVSKSTSAERLRDNLAAVDITLTDAEMDQIAAMDRQEPGLGFTHHDPRMLDRLLERYE